MPLRRKNPGADGTWLLIRRGLIFLLLLLDVAFGSEGGRTEQVKPSDATLLKDPTHTPPSDVYGTITAKTTTTATTLQPENLTVTKQKEFSEELEPESSVSRSPADENMAASASVSTDAVTHTPTTSQSPQMSGGTSSEGTHAGAPPPSLLSTSTEASVSAPTWLNHTQTDGSDSVSPSADENDANDTVWTLGTTTTTTTTTPGDTPTPRSDTPHTTSAQGPTSPTSPSGPSTTPPKVRRCVTFSCAGVGCFQQKNHTQACEEDMKFCELRRTWVPLSWSSHGPSWEAGCARSCRPRSPCSILPSAARCQQECCQAGASSCLRLDGSINVAGSAPCWLPSPQLLAPLLCGTVGLMNLL